MLVWSDLSVGPFFKVKHERAYLKVAISHSLLAVEVQDVKPISIRELESFDVVRFNRFALQVLQVCNVKPRFMCECALGNQILLLWVLSRVLASKDGLSLCCGLVFALVFTLFNPPCTSTVLFSYKYFVQS